MIFDASSVMVVVVFFCLRVSCIEDVVDEEVEVEVVWKSSSSSTMRSSFACCCLLLFILVD